MPPSAHPQAGNPKHECDITQEAITSGLAEKALVLCTNERRDVGMCRFVLRMNSAGHCRLLIKNRTYAPEELIASMKVDRNAGALVDTGEGTARVLMLDASQSAIFTEAVRHIVEARHTSAAKSSSQLF